MKGNHFDRHAHSAPVQEIMGTPPSWITRWGIIVIFTVISVILIACCLIECPQTLTAKVTVSVTDDGSVSGRMLVASSGAGNIRTGQKAIVRLDCYPYMEFGTFEGEVRAVCDSPEEATNGQFQYAVDLSFPEGLVSRYGYQADFFRKMSGTAQIILQNRKLIEIIVYDGGNRK